MDDPLTVICWIYEKTSNQRIFIQMYKHTNAKSAAKLGILQTNLEKIPQI